MAGESEDSSTPPAGAEPPKKAVAKVFNCPHCGGSVTLRTLGQAVTAVCGSCGCLIDVANENLKVIELATKALKIEPVIPLGTRGKIKGELLEVVGFMERCDATGVYTWREYLLFNPYKGFRWLVEADGHWSFTQTIMAKLPSQEGQQAIYQGQPYRLFHRDNASVTYVVGEFYWRVRVGEKVSTTDFIRPPYILSAEKSSDEIVWSLGEYIDAATIRTAFAIKTDFPTPKGVSPNQPGPAATKIFKYWGAAATAICLIQFLTMAFAQNKQVWSEGYTLIRPTAPAAEAGSEQTLGETGVSPPFELKGAKNNLVINFRSQVENGWLELEGALINDTTNVATPFAMGLEYYHGYDGGESWSEGDRATESLLADIPAGNYHLSFDVTGTQKIPQGGIEYRVGVNRGTIVWSNAFFALLFISIVPLWKFHTRTRFETQRWADSEFTPYSKSSSANSDDD